jgi:hypothetical protein
MVLILASPFPTVVIKILGVKRKKVSKEFGSQRIDDDSLGIHPDGYISHVYSMSVGIINIMKTLRTYFHNKILYISSSGNFNLVFASTAD